MLGGPSDYYQDWLEVEEVDELTLDVANNVGSVICLLKCLQNPYLKVDRWPLLTPPGKIKAIKGRRIKVYK